jgi:alpha-ribazole phosphatase
MNRIFFQEALFMLELILVRHGETDSNKKGTYLGWTDAPLNETGLSQAHIAAEKLKDTRIDRIYASPLQRAMKTAEIINEFHSLQIAAAEELKERNFGSWDDLTHKDILCRYPAEYEAWTRDWIHYCMEGGESSIQAYERITCFIDEMVKTNDSGTFLIITHLGCIRKIVAYLLGMGIEGSWRFKLDNATVTKLMVNDEKYTYLTLLNA